MKINAMSYKVQKKKITNSKCEKQLDIKIDSNLNFEVITQCSNKDSQSYAFTSQFSYCPLTWMFHNIKLKDK